MRVRTLVWITVSVVLAVFAFFFIRYLIADEHRADQVRAEQEQGTDRIPIDEMEAAPGVTLESSPSPSPASTFAAPDPDKDRKSCEGSKGCQRMFDGKFSVRIPGSWCKRSTDTYIKYEYGNGTCSTKKVVRFSDLSTTSSTDLFVEWAGTSCEGGDDEHLLEGPAPVTFGDVPGEFYRLSCSGSGNHFHYAWLIEPKNLLVTAEDSASPRTVESVLATVKWR